jgi:mannose-6-phosphate isomerase-like protein (cupin superfamily)
VQDQEIGEVRNRSNAEHYVWGGGCDGWRLVSSESLAVTQERMPPGSAEVPHYHQIARQVFFVLRGELTIVISTTRYRLRAGDSLVVSPRCPHEVINTRATDTLFLVISSPSTVEDRVELDLHPNGKHR